MLFISGSIQQKEEIATRFDTVTVQDVEKMVEENDNETREKLVEGKNENKTEEEISRN